MKKLGTLLLTGGILLALASPAYAQRPAETEAVGAGTPALVVAAEEKTGTAALSATNSVVASGNCGEEGNESSLTWTLDDAGTLTISGNGLMGNYGPYYNCIEPWASWRDQIRYVVIEEGVTSIGENAFYFYSNLERIAISTGVTSIGDTAFGESESLTEIHVDAGNSTYCDQDGILFSKDGTEIVCFPAGRKEGRYDIPKGVTSIGRGAFYSCRNLSEITIPNSVTRIEMSAFAGCRGLSEVTIPDSVTSIEWDAFSMCSGLTKITISNSVTNIEMGSFSGCSSLVEITIPDSVTSIGMSAFNSCSRLTKVTIPDSVTSIESGAFYSCDSLADVYYGGTKEQWKAIDSRFNEELTSATIHYNSGSSGGCYVATAVYGSYDCPEVWTLRRYRDYELSQTAAGRAFIRTYYAVSPTIVEHFGEEEWFQDMWRGPLDKMVADLQAKGYESTPYEDIAW